MPSFILRKIEPELWDRVKAQATKEGRPLRWVLLRLVALYATQGLNRLEQLQTWPAEEAESGHINKYGPPRQDG